MTFLSHYGIISTHFAKQRDLFDVQVLLPTGLFDRTAAKVSFCPHFSDFLIGIFTDSEAIISLTKGRLILICLTNFITCSMEVLLNAVRSLNRPKSVLVVGIVCGFLIRSIWAWFVWPISKTLPFLFICFPLSTFVGCIIYFFIYRSAIKKEAEKLTIEN